MISQKKFLDEMEKKEKKATKEEKGKALVGLKTTISRMKMMK